MQLATSTNILFGRPDGSRVPLEEAIPRVARAGFRVLDMNFYDWAEPGDVFSTDGWRAWIEGVARAAEENGVRFGQTHAYFYDFLDPALTEEERARQEALTLRSIEASRLLGAGLAVLHPQTDYSTPQLVKRSREANADYFRRLLEKTERWDMRIAVENMWDLDTCPRRKYCVTAEELAGLLDAVGSGRLGACWDFEHGDIMRQDQAAEVRWLGKRLFAVHASDQHGYEDMARMHLLPMLGGIDWPSVVGVLKEIGYEGYFTFESHNFVNTLPDCAVDTALRLACEVGQYLVNL